MKRISIIIATLLIIAMCMSGCGKGSDLVGEWTVTQDTSTLNMTFYEDMTGKINRDGLSAGFTYVIEDNTVTIIPVDAPSDTMEATFSVSGYELTMITTDGYETVFKRVK